MAAQRRGGGEAGRLRSEARGCASLPHAPCTCPPHASAPTARYRGPLLDFRYVRESVPNTLGWGDGATEPAPLADDYRAMLASEAGAVSALRWLGALSAKFELVALTEHLDASLLLLGKLHGWPLTELVYLSQKRRRTAATRHAYDDAPAARAAANGSLLAGARGWPAASLLREGLDAPWLWPHELDSLLRANWLDSLAYVHFNATLWRRIDAAWAGPDGARAFDEELGRFRRLRAAVQTSCAR